MGKVQSLGYIGLAGQDLDAWRHFSATVLGTQAVGQPAGDAKCLKLRLDEKSYRFLIQAQPAEVSAWFGLEVASLQALKQLAGELRGRGIAVTQATAQEMALRAVQDMVWLDDPDGNRLELYVGLPNADSPFQPDRPMGGFRTGDQGLGHVVFVVNNLERARDFYCDALGFRVSDYVLEPNRRVFLRTNGRHHSVALAERAGSGIAHVMVEVNDFDDVGRSYDVAMREHGGEIYSTLGRHSNDHMTSFYVKCPAGFPIEYGWGGREVDDATWQVQNLFGPSLWGHDRVGGGVAAREAANAQREHALREGIRVPLTQAGEHRGD